MKTNKQASEDDDPLLVIDQRVESYKQFFDYEWSRRILAFTEPAPKLNSLVHKLGAAWKVASNTAMMPWLMNESLRGVTNGYNKGRSPEERIGNLLNVLRLKVLRELPHSLEVKLQINELLSRMMKQISLITIPDEKLELPPKFVWDHFIDNKDFQMSLWGSQCQAFSAVYFPYENFLVQCVRRASGSQKHYPNCKAIEDAYKETFSEQFAKRFVMDDAIHEARLVRNAIVHNGGVETEKLRSITHRYRIEGKQIQIMPEHIKELFTCLKFKVHDLCEHLVKMNQFK